MPLGRKMADSGARRSNAPANRRPAEIDPIDVASAAGSAPIYPLLKRVDEREVTMLAYDNPAFVEDVARDVAVALKGDERVTPLPPRPARRPDLVGGGPVESRLYAIAGDATSEAALSMRSATTAGCDT